MNLLVKFKLRGDSRFRIKGAARIKVDAEGRLTLFDAQGGAAETIAISDVDSISIHSVTRGVKAA